MATTANDSRGAPAPKARSAPEVVAPTNRVNVALPFSHLHVEESSKDLAELAAVVTDLVSIVQGLTSSTEIEALRERAETLAARFR